jgi:hypothetical protein
MQRVIQGRNGTISTSFADSDPIPKTATVTVTNDAGTKLVDAQAATSDDKGGFTYALTPTQTESLDRLTAVWTAGSETQTTYCDVAGGFLASLDDISASLPTSVNPSDDELVAKRTLAEEALEDACYVSFVPRFRRQVLDCPALERGRMRNLREVKVNGSALTTTANVRVVDQRSIPMRQFFTDFYGGSVQSLPSNLTPQIVEVAYEHGWDEPPPLVSRAVESLARFFLTPNPSDYDQRATSISTDEAHYSLITPGVGGAIFALPEVNAVVERYGLGPGS